MSAKLLWFIAFLLGTQASALYIDRHESDFNGSLQNETLSLKANDVLMYAPNRRIVVEEVDKNGNSVVKELELPNYDDGEEVEEGAKGGKKEEKRCQSQPRKNKRGRDMYGCESRRENRRRKCLQRQKKLLRKRYKNWKEAIRRIIKDLDRKIKILTSARKKESTANNLNFLSGFSPGNAKRKKE